MAEFAAVVTEGVILSLVTFFLIIQKESNIVFDPLLLSKEIKGESLRLALCLIVFNKLYTPYYA